MAKRLGTHVHVGLRLPAEVREQLQKLADKEQRDFSNYVRKVLFEHVQKNKPARNGAAHIEAPAA